MTKELAISIAALVLSVPLTTSVLQGQTDSKFCNNRLLNGNYGFAVEGYKLAGPVGSPTGPMRGVAMTTFDGNGNLTQLDTVVVNGVKISDFTEEKATGTYQVNPDCTGTFNIKFPSGDPRPPVTANLVITENGNEIDTVVIDPPGALLVASHGKKRFTWW